MRGLVAQVTGWAGRGMNKSEYARGGAAGSNSKIYP